MEVWLGYKTRLVEVLREGGGEGVEEEVSYDQLLGVVGGLVRRGEGERLPRRVVKENGDLKKRCRELEDKLVRSEQNVKDLHPIAEQCKEIPKELIKENGDLKKRCKELEEKLARSEQNVRDLHPIAEHDKEIPKELIKENGNLKKQVKELEEKCARTEQNVRDLHPIEENHAEEDTASQEVDDLKKTLKELCLNKEQQQKLINSLELSIEEMKSSQEQDKAEVALAGQTKKSLEEEAKQSRGEAESLRTRVQEQESGQESRDEERRTELARLKEETGRREAGLKEELASLWEGREGLIRELEAAREGVRMREEEWRNRLEQEEEKVGRLQGELENMRGEREGLVSAGELDLAREEAARLSMDVEKARTQVAHLEDAQTARLASACQEAEATQQTTEDLTSRLADAAAALVTVSGQLEVVNNENKLLSLRLGEREEAGQQQVEERLGSAVARVRDLTEQLEQQRARGLEREEGLEQELGQEQEEKGRLARRAEEQEAEVKVLHESRQQVDQVVARLQERLATSETEVGLASEMKQRLTEADMRARQLEQELVEERGAGVREQQERVRELGSRLEEQAGEVAKAEEREEVGVREIARLRVEVVKLEEEQERSRNRCEALILEQEALRSRCQELETMIQEARTKEDAGLVREQELGEAVQGLKTINETVTGAAREAEGRRRGQEQEAGRWQEVARGLETKVQELKQELGRRSKESRIEEEKDVDEAENLGVDKNMVQVLNEKIRENSQLKGEKSHLMQNLNMEIEEKENALKELEESRQTYNTMNAETVRKLSILIRDKDLEIESLSERNKSLLEVIDNEKEKVDISNKYDLEKELLLKEIEGLKEQDVKVKTDVENSNELIQLKGKVLELEKMLRKKEVEQEAEQEAEQEVRKMSEQESEGGSETRSLQLRLETRRLQVTSLEEQVACLGQELEEVRAGLVAGGEEVRKAREEGRGAMAREQEREQEVGRLRSSMASLERLLEERSAGSQQQQVSASCSLLGHKSYAVILKLESSASQRGTPGAYCMCVIYLCKIGCYPSEHQNVSLL